MAQVVDPFKQDRIQQAQNLRSIADDIRGAGRTIGRSKVAAAQTELSGAVRQQDASTRIAASNQAQINALLRIEAQGKETRKTQEAGITLVEERKAKSSAASQATFNELIGRTVSRKELDTPRGFESTEIPRTGGPKRVEGNIDLSKRPLVRNADGTVSSVLSISINVDGKEVLIPTISPTGEKLTNDQAIALFKKTGKHLGKFDTVDEANAAAKRISAGQGKAQAPTPIEDEGRAIIDVAKRGDAGQLTPGDLPIMENARDILEVQLQNALASPDEKAGRKAALFINTKLEKLKDQIKGLRSAEKFKQRSERLAKDLEIPEAAITPENLTKFETELVDQLFKGPEIPGSTDVTLQFLVKFPEWRQVFQDMRAAGEGEIDLESEEVTAFLDRNKRMFNTFADKFITQTDTQVDPITSKQAILYRTERDKFLRNLGPFTELQGNIRLLKQQAEENTIWDATVEVSDGLSAQLKKFGLNAKIFDEDEVGELEAVLAQMKIESVNPLLRSVENVVLNSPIEVQGLFASELSERLQEAGISSDAMDNIIKKLSGNQ